MYDINEEKYFTSFPTMERRRNRFPFKKEVNYDLKMGELKPLCAIRAYPGLTYNLDLANVMRVAPLQNPPQDSAIAKFFAFYFPDRITWENYKYWFGEKKNPENPELEPTYMMPKVKAPDKTGFKANGFYDNIGCVPGIPNIHTIHL